MAGRGRALVTALHPRARADPDTLITSLPRIDDVVSAHRHLAQPLLENSVGSRDEDAVPARARDRVAVPANVGKRRAVGTGAGEDVAVVIG